MAYIGTSPSNGVRRKHTYTATANQTSFSGNDDNGVSLVYVDTEYLDVYQNGVKLVAVSDYASTTGTSVVLTQGASVSDIIEIIVFDIFSVADTVSASDGGSFGGNVGMGGTLAVTGNTTVGGTLGVTGVSTLADNIVFGASGKGIHLGVTSATAANLLEDYEEGTFTPVFAFGGSTNGLTYGNKVGSYTKVGNRVHTSGIVQLTGKDGAAIGSGTVTIVGFPFTISNNNTAYAAAGLRMQNITFADSPSLATVINSTTADLREITNAGSVTTLNNGNIAADSYVIFSLSYQTDA